MENNRPELNQEPTPTPVDATNYEPGAKSKKIKPIIIIAAIVLVLSAIATTAVIVLQQQETKPQAQTPTETTQSTPFKFKASVPYVLGTAYKIIDERKIEIKEGDILEEGDAILTEENSKLILSLDDGSVIRIGANSKITLSKMQTAETTIEEEVGIIFARVQKDESHRFITKTGNVTVESLGTTFSVENSGEDVNVKVFKNKVAVNETAIDKESIEKVEVEENQEWKFEGDKPAIIDFYADWCQPCKIVEPVLEELSEEYKGKVDVFRIDTEDQQELAAMFGIKSIPSILFIPQEEQPQMAQGALPKDTLEKAIQDVLKVENN